MKKIFARIDEKTEYPMPNELKKFYRKEFESQLNFITETYDKIKSSKQKL